MKHISQMLKHLLMLQAILLSMVFLPLSAQAQQADGPHLGFKKQNADAWAKQDQQIDQKLAALEKKTGKKPNIIFIGIVNLSQIGLIFYLGPVT